MAHASRLTLETSEDLDRVKMHPRRAERDVQLPGESVGPDLSIARKHRGKTLSDVWLVLKIRPEYLIAIEEGRFEVLPGRVYAIGYVRSYAAYLGLDAAKFVERAKAEIAGRWDIPVTPADEFSPPPERRLPHAGAVVAGLLVVALIYSGYNVLASAGRASEPPVMPVPARLAAETGLTQKPAVERTLASLPAPAPIRRPEPALPVPGEITVTPAVASPAGPVPKVEAPLPQGRRYGLQNRTSRITLRVHRPTHVAIQGTRNRSYIDRPLFPGDTYRVPNIVNLRLNSPDAGAVELILDGVSMGFAGRDGAVARGLLLNPQAIVDRQPRG